jgi:hypothetical protein
VTKIFVPGKIPDKRLGHDTLHQFFMNVRQLKEQLAGISDEALVVVPAPNHNYRLAGVDSMTAVVFKEHRRVFIEELIGQDVLGGTLVSVLVFS